MASHLDARGPVTASGALLNRARAGDHRALSTLFRRQGDALRRWAHGRLPLWARRMTDTVDLVQDALLQTFRRIDRFEHRGKGALQAYLRQAVSNRIRDEMRSVGRRPFEPLPEELPHDSRDSSPFDQVEQGERERRYKAALHRLSEQERLLVVGRIELGYSYAQLALLTGRATPDAARVAVRRTIVKLAEVMARH